MRRALTSAVTLVALAALAAAASAQERVHVRDVRAGAHPGFDRVVIELDGPTDIAWERGPNPGEESFYLDADLGRRGREVHTKLAQVGTISLRAMRVGTRVALEPRERRVRAYVLQKPTRLVVDLAPPGAEEFAVPKGVTPLAPAKALGPLDFGSQAGEPPRREEPAPQAPPPPPREAEAPPAPTPPKAEAAPAEAQPPAPAEQAGGAAQAESPPGEAPQAEAPQAEAPPAEAPPAEAPPEAAAPAEAKPAETPEEAAPPPAEAPSPAPAEPEAAAPERAPEPLPPAGFPWGLALASAALLAALAAGLVALRRSGRAEPAARPPAPRPTPFGVESISPDDLRLAADATSVLEQRLDEEVRARIALEERLAQAGEELKVLRDRLHRIERRREEAP